MKCCVMSSVLCNKVLRNQVLRKEHLITQQDLFRTWFICIYTVVSHMNESCHSCCAMSYCAMKCCVTKCCVMKCCVKSTSLRNKTFFAPDYAIRQAHIPYVHSQVWLKFTCVTWRSHTCECVMPHMCASCHTRVSASCHTRVNASCHICMSRATCESIILCHVMYERVTQHSRATYESSYELVIYIIT